MVTTTEDNVVTPFLGGNPGPDQPRPRTRSHTRARAKSGKAKDPTAALRKRRQRAKQDRDAERDIDRDVSASVPQGWDKFSSDLGKTPQNEKPNEINAHVTITPVDLTVQDAPPIMPKMPVRHGHSIRFAAGTAAVALAVVSGGFSITGMTAIFVGAYWPVIGMGIALEVGKLWLWRGSATTTTVHPGWG